jgi:DNA-directed RNA polymerase specialized sigma24 family protein
VTLSNIGGKIVSNWAEEMIDSIEKDIANLELLEKKASDEMRAKQYRLMYKPLQKQLLDLYRHAIKEGTPFDLERLKKYENFHQSKKLYLSDPQLEERSLSPIMRTKSAEEEMFFQQEEDRKKKGQKDDTTLDLSFLSKRQEESIRLYADGLTYSDIGELLSVEKGTVSKHLQLARSKAKNSCNFSVQMELSLEEADEISCERDKPKRAVKVHKVVADSQLELPLKVKVRKKKSKRVKVKK